MDAGQHPRTFQEQQRALCMLSEFINEKESWLDGALNELRWTREGVMSRVSIKVCALAMNIDLIIIEKRS